MRDANLVDFIAAMGSFMLVFVCALVGCNIAYNHGKIDGAYRQGTLFMENARFGNGRILVKSDHHQAIFTLVSLDGKNQDHSFFNFDTPTLITGVCYLPGNYYVRGSELIPLDFKKWFTDGYQARINFEHDIGAGLAP